MIASKNAISSNRAFLILNLLSEKDMHGYEMIAALSERSKNVFESKTGMLYPLLHELTKEGYLTSYNQEINGKLRKYYHITQAGKAYTDKLMTEWNDYVKSVMNMRGGGLQDDNC